MTGSSSTSGTTSWGRAVSSSLAKWQATVWSGLSATTGLSGGSSVAQISGLPSRSRSQQRVWKRQPDGGLAGLGMSPLRMIRRRDRSVRASGTGTADSSAIVYGWRGCA